VANLRIFLLSLFSILSLAASLALPLRPANAAPQAITAGEVMALVNELRRSRGLQPYTVDAGITAYAQEHSAYQASIQTSTHLHSDGQTSLAHGLVENVAGGTTGYLTAQAVVYQIWADPVHMKTMVGYTSGAAGVGVASSGGTDYVTLNVRPGGEQAIATRPGGASSIDPGYTPIALVPLTTATMKPSGAVIHEVGYGQTLWAIALAYGVPAARIRELNGMAASDSSIWAGQRLLIVPAGLVTPTPLPAEASPAVPTPLAMRSSATPAPTRTPLQAAGAAPTATNGLPASGLAARIKIDPVLAGLLGLAALGLLLTLSSGIKIKRRE
jgi:LysM repeat protein